MMQPSFGILGLLVLVFAKGEAEIYECPAGWNFGTSCGNHNCYRVVSVPPANVCQVFILTYKNNFNTF